MSWLIDLIQSNGALSVFWGGVIEEIFVPVPSPLVAMAGGVFLVGRGGEGVLRSLLMKVVLPFSLGATLGSYFVYFIAFFGGQFLIERFKKYLGFDWRMVEKTRDKFIKGSGDELAIFLLRAIPVVPVSLVSGVCGVVRLNWREFAIFTFLGLAVRGLILGFLGWQAGAAYETLMAGFDRVENLVLIGTFLFFMVALVWLYYKREKFFRR